MGNKLKGTIIAVVVFTLSACTGSMKDNPFSHGIVIPTGSKLYVDLQDANQFQLTSPKIELRTMLDNFSSTALISDITSALSGLTPANQKYTLILRKDIQTARPLLVIVNAEDIGAKFIDVLFDGDDEATPGMVSTLAFELIKNYPNKTLSGYTSAEFKAIKALVKTRVDEMMSQSESLSFATTPYARMVRYFKNGLGHNPAFMTAVRAAGVNYHSAGKTANDPFDLVTPRGLTCEQTPEGCNTADGLALKNYQYIDNLKTTLADGSVIFSVPFDQPNILPEIMPSVTSPFPADNISVAENQHISLTTKIFDLDGDFIDKSMSVDFIPRKLPSANVIMVPERSASTTQLSTNGPDDTDYYISSTIGYNEALDLNVYASCSSDPDPNLRDCDTAYQNVYYLYTDGSVLMAAKWNFRYIDLNRPPQFITDANGDINDSSFDSSLAQYSGDTLHKSYCDTDLNVLQTRINSRNDNPWSCVFRTYDPDLDDDPNGAADSFYYTVTAIDPFAELKIGKPSELSSGFLTATKVTPLVAPATAPALVAGEMVTTGCGSHLRCGVGVFQITVDNGVKVAAETKSNLLFDYTIVSYDRQQNGFSSERLVERYIDFTPVPARFVSFEQDSVPAPLVPASDAFNIVKNPAADIVPSPTPGGFVNVHSRKEVYLSEIISAAKGIPVADGTLAPTYGFINETGAARTAFEVTDLNSSAHALSRVITQPRMVKATASPNPSPTFTIPTYTYPFEYDSTCSVGATSNNSTAQSNGFVFELNAVDLDNVGLKPGEPSDPVYLNKRAIVHDASTTLNANALQYCIYTAPTSDVTLYQKYANDAAMDACTWSNTPPNLMQPIPVFYDDAGTVKKLVYHRLRVKWQPKDEKASYNFPGVLENTLNNFLLWGNRDDPRDGNNFTEVVNLYAKRKEMQPCATESDSHGKVNYFNQDAYVSSATGVTLGYIIKDENKRGGYAVPSPSPSPDYRLHGRQQADVVVYSNPSSPRSIADSSFIQWVPFLRNCTQITSGSVYNEPLIFHSLQGDASALPHARLNSGIDRNDLCFGANFKSLSNPNHIESNGLASQYRSVVLIYNKSNQALTGANAVVLNPPAQTKCFQQDTLDLFPNQSIVAIASSCDYSNAQISDPTNNPLWDDANTKGLVALNINPANFGISNVTPSYLAYPFISFNWMPEFFQTVRQDPATPANLNAINALYFTITPFDTYRFDSANVYGGGNYYVYGATTGVVGPGIVNDPVKNTYLAIPSSTPGAEYGLLDPTGANVSPRLAPTPTAGGTPFPYDVGYQVVDWNYSPMFIAVDFGANPTPTPVPDGSTSVFYRSQPGDATKTQIFIKNGGSAIVPIRTSDVSGNINYEKDPFDVHSYTIANWSGSGRPTPTLTRTVSGGNCSESDIPAGYPANITNSSAYSTLYSVLQNYRKCNVLWTPDTTASRLDDGRKYTFDLRVKDNPNGVGGRYPDGVNTFIPNANGANTVGNLIPYGFTIEVIETNQNPTFTATSNGSAISATLAANPTISAYPTPATSDCQQKDISGNNIGPCDETLQSDTAIQTEEGTASSFAVYVKSPNKTQAFRTLTASRPTYVRVLENSGTIRNYNVPSFASMSWNATQSASDITNGVLNVSFSWKPTDAEAFNLSTVDGFLIPVDVVNQSYDPAPSDASFPTTFKTPAKKSRVWIWAKVKVSSTPAVVQLMNFNGTGAIPLQDNKITLTAGQINTMRFQVQKTADIAARTAPAALTDTFQPTLVAVTGNETALNFTTLNRTIYTADAGTTFAGCAGGPAPTPAALPTPGVSSNAYREDYPVTFCPSISEAGKQYLMTLRVTDPGDVSLGLSKYPDPVTTCNSKVVANYSCRSMSDTSITSKVSNIQFLVQIVGPPQFVSPRPSPTTTAYAYINQDFSFPLSLKITRPAERRQNFFIGLDSAAATTGSVPFKNSTLLGASTFAGFYVSEKFALRWWGVHSDGHGGVQPTATFQPAGAAKTIPMLAVLKTYCQASNYIINTGAGDKTLIRYNEATSLLETCKVRGADITNNSAAASMNIALNYSSFNPALPTVISARAVRSYTVSNTGSPQTEINQQFADFKGRCRNCDISPSTSGTSVDGLSLTSSSPSTVVYGGGGSNSGYTNTFTFNGTAITKEYADVTPPPSISAGTLPTQSISFMPAEGENITFKTELSALPAGAPFPEYHWFVNGCLKYSGFITDTSTCTIDGNSVPCITQDFELSTLMSGRNDDCAGEYSISEAGADGLGKAVVRFTVGRGNEVYTASPAYDGTSLGYVWVAKILNLDPFVNSDPNPTPSPNMAAPIKLSGTDYTGDSNSTFALPVTFASKEFIAYSDESKTASVKIRLKQIDDHGDINTALAPNTLSLDCGVTANATTKLVSPSTNLQFLGINPENGSGSPTLTISVSKDDTFTNSNYVLNSWTCFSNTLSMTNKTVFEATENAKSNLLVASNMVYSKFTASALPISTFFSADVNATYLLYKQFGVSRFWDTTPITSNAVLPVNTPEFTSYSKNEVRKIVTSNAKVFYLIGSKESNPSSLTSRGFIIYQNLALQGTNLVLASPSPAQSTIAFTSGTGSDPAANSQDCAFNGSPVDAAYFAANDTLIATVNSYDSPYGRMVAIKNISTIPVCKVLNDRLLNPSLATVVHNVALAKMLLDPQHGLIYGVTTAAVGSSGQFFVVDPLSEKVVIRELPSSLYPHELVFSNNANALYIYDNRRSGTTVFPLFYRIW